MTKTASLGIVVLVAVAAGIRCEEDSHPADPSGIPVVIRVSSHGYGTYEVWFETLDLLNNQTRRTFLYLIAPGEELIDTVYLEPSTPDWLHYLVLYDGVVAISSTTPIPVTQKTTEIVGTISGGIITVGP